MSYREAAIEVLRAERRPMTAKEIIAAANARGLLTSCGRTPDASLAGRLYTDIQRNGKDSLFIQVGPRKYALREWCDQFTDLTPQNSRLKEILLKMGLERVCEKFYNAIMSLNDEKRSNFIRDLIAGVRAAGANVTNHLLLLGVHSGRPDVASASDIALLLRYYRVNQPKIFDVAIAIIERFHDLSVALMQAEGELLPAHTTSSRSRARANNANAIREEKAS